MTDEAGVFAPHEALPERPRRRFAALDVTPRTPLHPHRGDAGPDRFTDADRRAIIAGVLAELPRTGYRTSWARVVGLFVVAIALLVLAAFAPVLFPDAANPAIVVFVALGAAAAVLGGFSVPGIVREISPTPLTRGHHKKERNPE